MEFPCFNYELPNHQLFLNFSLDGPPMIHNKIRGVMDGYQRTWSTSQAIKTLSRSNKSLRVNLEITVSDLNIVDYLKNPKRQVMPCVLLLASCALDPRGEVKPCFMWGESLGKIKKE